MSNIHDVIKEDDVKGHIIGRMLAVGVWIYDGRKQGQQIYADNYDELIEKANLAHEERIKEFGESFTLIYPSNNWHFRVYQY